MTPQQLEELRKAQGAHDKMLSKAKFDKFSAAAGIASQFMGGGGMSDAGSGAVSGAMSGAAFGPPGAIVGGIAGAVMGAASAREARKAHNAKIEMQKHQALAEIEQKKGQEISQALGQMGMRMGMSLR